MAEPLMQACTCKEGTMMTDKDKSGNDDKPVFLEQSAESDPAPKAKRDVSEGKPEGEEPGKSAMANSEESADGDSDNEADDFTAPGWADNARKLGVWARFLLWLLGGLFAKVKFFKKNVKLIKKYHEQGAVVHVFQYRSYLEHLILNHFLLKAGLPPVIYPDESWLVWLWRQTLGRLSSIPAEIHHHRRIDEKVKAGEHFLIFLQGKSSFLSVRDESSIDQIETLLDIQRQTETPIFLVPHITIWNKQPANAIQSPIDVLFGNSLRPGKLRRWIIFLRNYNQAFIRSGEPLRTDDWTSDAFAEAGKSAVKEMRWRLFKFFSEERMAVTGPMTRPRTWILESVLNSDEVQEVIHQVAREEQRTVEDVTAEAARELDFMAADYRYTILNLFATFLSATLWKLYNPLVIDDEGIERIRELVKKQSVVYVPSHKSHADYLTWSWVLNHRGVYPPHIIAGENLSFWPMGYLFRRMGAIFIKRSFKGNKLYATLLRRYLTRMLWEGYSQEFFIEGTRSRTGKLLMPKYGILSIYMDAYLNNPERDLIFVPVSVIYNKLIEEQSYSKELSGGKKAKESTGSLIKLLELLRFRFGALYVRVGNPMSMNELLAERGLVPTQVDAPARRQLIREVAFDIIYRINEVSTATPSCVVSTALLAAGRKGVTQKALIEYIELALEYLKAQGVHLSENLGNSLYAVTETIEAFVKDGTIQSHTIGDEVVYTINDNKRYGLDYYKNYVLHYFSAASFIAIAFGSLAKNQAKLSDVRERTLFLADLFRYEIVYPPGGALSEQIDRALDYLVAEGAYVREEDGLLSLGPKADLMLPFFRNQLFNFLESYWVVAASLPRLLGARIAQGKFIEMLMNEGKKLTLIGEVERGEAYSKTNFQNAILYFIHRGIVIRDEAIEDTSVTILPTDYKDKRKLKKKLSGKPVVYLELTEEYASAEVLDDLARELKLFLAR
jgi:glycerol-3-phosphate O-acyltransferase